MLADIFPWSSELISVTLIAIFMSISPGADFVMITRNSIFYGRKAGLYASLGISIAIWVHVAYSIAGLAVIISKSVLLFTIIKYLGAAYLIYVGWITLQAKSIIDTDTVADNINAKMSSWDAFKVGFITNVLNPKTTLFFLSIFTQVIDPQTPLWVQFLYGAIISMAHLLWFSCVSIFLSQPTLLKLFQRFKKRIEQLVGAVLIAFGLKIAASNN